MRRITINEHNLMSVDVVDEIIEICTREPSGADAIVSITQVAWDEICEKVINGVDKRASRGEEVE
ncbi:hypothetical protein ES705_23650 [subsurface metagenome]